MKVSILKIETNPDKDSKEIFRVYLDVKGLKCDSGRVIDYVHQCSILTDDEYWNSYETNLAWKWKARISKEEGNVTIDVIDENGEVIGSKTENLGAIYAPKYHMECETTDYDIYE